MYDNFEQLVEEAFKSSKEKIVVPDIDYSKSPQKRKAPKLAAAIILAFALLSISVCAICYPQVFSAGFKDLGLESLSDSEYESFSSLCCVNNGITLYAKAIVSDTSRTVIQVEIKGNSSGTGIPDLEGITLKDDDGNSYDVSNWGAGTSNSNTKVDKTPIEFTGGPKKETTLTLSITEINGTKGIWNIRIPVKPITSEGSETCDVVYNFKNGISFKIDKISFYATETIFHGTFINYFEIDYMGPIYSVLLIDNGKQISDNVTYFGGSSEFTVTTPPIGMNDKIKLKFTLGIDNPSSLTKTINSGE